MVYPARGGLMWRFRSSRMRAPPMPLRRALAGLALACLALLLAGPAHAQCADTDIWCATMTVGHVDPTTGIDPFNDGAPFVRFDASDEAAGYSAAGVGAGALEPASFTVDGVTYTVEYLYNSYLKPGSFTHATSTGLYIGFSGPLPPALRGFLRLRLGNESLNFSDVWGNHGNQWFWQHTTRRSLHVRYPFRAWPAGEPVVVRLTHKQHRTQPGPPSGLAAGFGDGSLPLTWTHTSDGGSGISRYEYRVSSDGGGTWGTWGTVPGSGGDTTGFTAGNLTNDTTYTIEVRAVNGQGAGAAARVTATPRAASAPAAPVGLTAVTGFGQVMLAWTAPPNRGAAVTGYQYRQSADDGSTWEPDWTDVPGSGPDTVLHAVTGLTDGASYRFEVRATSGLGAGDAARTGRGDAGSGAVAGDGVVRFHAPPESGVGRPRPRGRAGRRGDGAAEPGAGARGGHPDHRPRARRRPCRRLVPDAGCQPDLHRRRERAEPHGRRRALPHFRAGPGRAAELRRVAGGGGRGQSRLGHRDPARQPSAARGVQRGGAAAGAGRGR